MKMRFTVRLKSIKGKYLINWLREDRDTQSIQSDQIRKLKISVKTKRSNRNLDSDIQNNFIEYKDKNESPRLIPEMNKTVDTWDQAINLNPVYNKIIHTQVQLPNQNKLQLGKII